MTTAKPYDGTAVLLHLIEAARAWALESGSPDDRRQAGVTLAGWVGTLERYVDQVVPPVPPVSWEPRRWRELVAGDRVSLGGVEAEVESAAVQDWHVDPRSSEYRPEPLEHSVVALRLVGRDMLYRMPPDGEVETFRGPAGAALDEANGRHLGLVEADRHMVLSSWAAEAFQTLEAAGLSPEPIAMTPPEGDQ